MSTPASTSRNVADQQQHLLGMELLFRSLQLKTRTDALVAAVHWILVTNGLKSIPNDEEGAAPGEANADAPPSELLPDGWNAHSDGFYILKYVGKEKLLVKISCASGILIINAMRYSDNETASISLVLSDYVLEDISNYAGAYKNLTDLKSNIETELVKKLIVAQKAVPIGVENSSHNWWIDDPTGGPYRRPSPLGSSFSDDEMGPEPPLVGRGDLDPLGRSQGGMLVNPRDLIPRRTPHPIGGIGPERLPRGSIPPGARFDPFGPPMPDLGRRPGFAGPDPDHLPPPGYGDMFG